MKTPRYWVFALLVIVIVGGAPQCLAEQRILLPFYVPHPRAIIAGNGIASLPNTMIPPATPNPIPGWTHPGSGYVPALGRSGLHIVIDDNWAEYKGYRNVGIDIHVSTASPTERELTVELEHAYDNYIGPTVTNRFTIQIPANATFIRHNLPIYSMSQNSSLRGATFSEDGREHKELALKNHYYYFGFTGTRAAPVREVLSLSPKLLLNSADVVDPANAANAAQTTINNYFNQVPSLYLISTSSGTTTPTGQPLSHLTSYDQLPTSALPYDYYKSIAVLIDDLRGLITTHPAQWKAIKEWVAQGGQLVVFNDSANEEKSFEKIDRMFLAGDAGDESRLERFAKKWQPFTFSEPSMRETLMRISRISLTRPKIESHFADQQLGVRVHGSGCVFLFGVIDGKSASGMNLDLAALENYTSKELQGGALQSAPEATNLRIPGVGDPPVTMFQIMITAFAIIIGPVNYVLLRRNKRLSWLMLTVPIGAALVAGVLFAYSMASDGFDIRVRALSVTHLDQNEQQAVTTARIAAYAGYTVGNGMKFSPTTAVDYIEDDSNSQQWYRYRPNRGVAFITEWTKGKDSPEPNSGTQHLSSGWISARKMQQFSTRRAYPCKRNFKFVQQEKDLVASNRLGCKVLWVAVQGEEDKLYVGNDIADAGTTSLKLTEEADVEKQLQESASQFSPAMTTVSRTSGVYTQIPSTFPKVVVDQLRNNQHKRNFVAIVEDWPDFEWGVENPLKVKPSIHLVTGEW